MDIQIGSIQEGKVTGIMNFGAFVSLPGGKSGLVHISEISNTFVKDVHDHLQVGQMVKVKVLDITEQGKINLSIKRAEETPQTAPARPAYERRAPRQNEPAAGRNMSYIPRENPRTNDESFEDKLKQFMQESDSKISGSRIYDQQRKSSRRRRD